MSETTPPWKHKRVWLLALPAVAATLVSLFALAETVVGGVGQSQPGDPLYGWRQSALQLELNLAVDPERRAAIEIALSATAPAQGAQGPALAAEVTVSDGRVSPQTGGPAPAGPTGAASENNEAADDAARPPVAAGPTAAPAAIAPPPASTNAAPSAPQTATEDNDEDEDEHDDEHKDEPAPASEIPDPTRTQAPSETPVATITAQPDDVRLTGTLESVGGPWVIAGQSVVVNGGTEILDNPAPGDTVEVRAWRYPDGTWVAYRIKTD